MKCIIRNLYFYKPAKATPGNWNKNTLMVKPNITGLTLKKYLEMRRGQLVDRMQSIQIYNSNYLPAWGEKRYTDEDLANIEMEIEQVNFLIVALRQFVSGELKLGKKNLLDRRYSVIENN